MKNILKNILSALSDKNIKFSDLRKFILYLGFSERIKGSHHIFFKKNISEIINLQSLKNGKAKAYQVKQVRNIIIKYELHKEEKNV
ncbi:MAG: type II toxin-antitoxin system HicA family toxin [Atribacterota bacterium]|jgi:predicted RNA binding protein YcfA (HicA-like mRNA interferase family)|nr:type II toxin-antitoxin system HicA family toxin [Atribacterota bacterium]MDD4289533.1 type II toxin-antitoxin system HicA family toxin [Atribacterota bacterium]MDD4765902.1 type II toxin-antitoxin system HicA family toxin [Atribacterota bacterium]MDD5636091.1 type II toxin-antitoxin system HicA family toxin [Atribacterota bacterium]